MEKEIRDLLKRSLHDKFSLVKRRENIYQLIAPLYHEDGDIMDIYIRADGASLVVCDCGMTLMRLSYYFDINTPRKEQIMMEIIADNGAQCVDGEILIPTKPNMLFANIMQFSQVIAKVSSMKTLRRKIPFNRKA